MKRLLSARRLPAASITPLFARQFAQQRTKDKVISKKDKAFLAALQRFHELHGHFLVPSSFVVPTQEAPGASAAAWPPETSGFELGKHLNTFTRGRETQFKKAMLQSIGFPHEDWRSYVWVEQTLPAMRAFRRIHGHLFVRQSFQVPTERDGHAADQWPRATWGLKLGAHCQKLRSARSNDMLSQKHVEDLDRIGFMWSDVQWKWNCQLLPSLKHFRMHFGHVQVPVRFSVPENDHRWPRAIWGFKLGAMAARVVEDVKLLMPPHDERAIKALHELDFFNDNAADEAWRDRVFPCLQTYSSLYRRGLLRDLFDDETPGSQSSGTDDSLADTDFERIAIPEDFVVPEDSQWPTRAWMMPLGYIVERICNSVLYSAQVQTHKHQLQRLGYGWDALYSKWARELLPALSAFHRKHGHSDVPINYVGPAILSSLDRLSIPGYRLGKQVAALRRVGRDAPEVADIIDRLDAIDFEFDTHESAFVARVLPALRAYVDKYGDCNVPQGFIIPSDDAAWPRATWGMKLGHTVRDIRSRHHYGGQSDAHQSELEALGFSWNVYRPRASTVSVDAVLDYWAIYQAIYGSEYVPPDFLIPGDDPRWPRESRHFGLGAWLHTYRQRVARAKLTTQRPVDSELSHDLPINGIEDAVSDDSSEFASLESEDPSLHSTNDKEEGYSEPGEDENLVREPNRLTALFVPIPPPGSRRARRRSPTISADLPQHQEQYWKEVVLASLHAYASLNGGSCSDMDAEYIIPSEEPFPPVAWGLNLGLRLWHIKYGDRYAVEVCKYEEELRALGITVANTKARSRTDGGIDSEDDQSEEV